MPVVAHFRRRGLVVDNRNRDRISVQCRFVSTLEQKARFRLVGPVGNDAGKGAALHFFDGSEDVGTGLGADP